MGAIDRKPIFDATRAIVRQFVPDWNYSRGDVGTLDRGIDAAIAAADAAPATMAPPPPPSAPAVADKPRTGLHNAKAFFDALRAGKLLGPDLSVSEVNGVSAICSACGAAAWGVSWTAYALGTAYLETAASMQPVREANWLSRAAAERYFLRMYDIRGARPEKARELGNLQPGDGARFCGRGYPQMTGRKNYAAAGAALGYDLVGNPDLAMHPDIAGAIMVWGIEGGHFTGKKAADYLPRSGPATAKQFADARRIINGQDRAGDVAAYCIEFQRALGLGDWS